MYGQTYCAGYEVILFPFFFLHDRDALVLSIAQGEVHVLQTLGRGTLKQVVDRGAHHHALARLVHLEAADLDAVLATDVLHQRRLTDDLDQLLTGVAVLVDLANVARRHGLVERDRDGVVNAAEPDGNVRDEGHLGAELGADLALVDVARQAVRNDVAREEVDVVLGGRA